MKLFLPFAADPVQAERVYARIAERLKDIGYELTADRVYKVIYKYGSKLVSESVGAASDNGEVVPAIFKNHIGYFICTYSQDVVWGEPLVARYSVTESVEFFDTP